MSTSLRWAAITAKNSTGKSRTTTTGAFAVIRRSAITTTTKGAAAAAVDSSSSSSSSSSRIRCLLVHEHDNNRRHHRTCCSSCSRRRHYCSSAALAAAASADATTSFVDAVLPNSLSAAGRRIVRDAVKSSFLKEAAKDDSHLWTTTTTSSEAAAAAAEDERLDDEHVYDNDRDDGFRSYASYRETEDEDDGVGVNDPVLGTLHDPLDDLLLQREMTMTEITTRTTTSSEAAAAAAISASDPFVLARPELDDLSRSIRRDLIGTDHPVLDKAASYFFDGGTSSADQGKRVRPVMVLLLSRALADTYAAAAAAQHDEQQQETAAEQQQQRQELFTAPAAWQRRDLPASQRRLAEISEMIHTASLFHDDVIDGAATRRGVPSVHSAFGNKTAILAGDYLLARASVHLARLRDCAVTEAMSTIIEHLVRGEVMQLRDATATATATATTATATTGTVEPHDSDRQQRRDRRRRRFGDLSPRREERLAYYLRKNYYKTASLMAHSCQSAAMLGRYPAAAVAASYAYGKHVGMAFQLRDDILDYRGSAAGMGKPALSDVKAGLATAPVLLVPAGEIADEMEPLIRRQFRREGDAELAVQLVSETAADQGGGGRNEKNGMERSQELAEAHADEAVAALREHFVPGPYRDALVRLADMVVHRNK